ncbi:SUSD1 protein, partial [Fregetta grallaria]|nr:SUSD1 protein [Fregetta grallaria]
DIDECEESGLCGRNARCVNTEGSYRCYCNDGYKLENGERSFHPDENIVSCKEIGCGSPPEMTHGYIVGNYSLLPGSAVHYECKEGFYSNEGKFSYCTANETWEPATLSCKGVDCGVPPSVLNAHAASVSGTTYGSEVTYNCVHGYFIASGNQTAVCNATGQWDGTDLVCKEEELFSNLSIFNETCVKWQRKTGRLGGQETYTFHILGQRWDEKMFSEDAIFNITTSEDNPKVCLDLNSGSNYVVNITTISSTNIAVSVTVAVQTKGRLCFVFSVLKEELTVLRTSILVFINRGVIRRGLKLITSRSFGTSTTKQTHSKTKKKNPGSVNLPGNIAVCRQILEHTWLFDLGQNYLVFRVKPESDTLKHCNFHAVILWLQFHVQGQRWYQEEFFHEMIFNLTTHKQAPEVCFDLQPGTNYSVNISMVALNFSLLVSMTTQIT